MINHLTRIASLVLAFGFFISCSTLQPNQQAEKSTEELSTSELRSNVAAIDEKLENSNQNPELYYRKGELLTKMARKQSDPAQRTALYDRARQSLSQAADLYDGTPQEGAEKAAHELFDSILKNGPIAVSKAIAAVYHSDDSKGYQVEADLFGMLCDTQDFQEGTTAFLEKRKPDFKGK